MLGQMVNVSACPRCEGEGKIVETPCETCHGDGRTERKRTLRVTIPAGIDEGHQIRLSNEGEAGPRGGPAGSLYVAVHVAPHPSLTRDGTELYLRGRRLDRPGGARHEDHGPDGRRRGGGRDQARDPARAPRSGCAARASRISGGRLARRPPRARRRRRADQALEARSASCSQAYAEEAGEHVGSGGGGLREKLGLRVTSAADVPEAARRRHGRGAWLELAVEADVEAVEAVSEILGRVAPGGTSVEPAFELVDEGLGARVDPTRPATVRAYVPARDRASADRAVAEAAEALGHLQAFGLRPIGELRTRVVHEVDWAEAWKAYFPVMRVGRRLVIRPTWRRHRAAAGRRRPGLDPGMAFGTGLHPTTRLCLAAVEALADRGDLAGARVLDVGCGSGILAIAAVKLGAAARRRRRHRPDRHRGDDRERRAATGSPAGSAARAGSLPTREGPFDVVLANLIAGLLVPLAPSLARRAPAGRDARGVGDLRRPRGRRPRGVRGGRA